jgi:hypothetical protein
MSLEELRKRRRAATAARQPGSVWLGWGKEAGRDGDGGSVLESGAPLSLPSVLGEYLIRPVLQRQANLLSLYQLRKRTSGCN